MTSSDVAASFACGAMLLTGDPMTTSNTLCRARARLCQTARLLRWMCGLCALCILMAARQVAASATDLEQPMQFDIPAQTPLDEALIEWGKRTGMQVMIATHTVVRRTTQGVRGTLPARVALEALLENSGLSYSTKGNTVTVAPRPKVSAARRSADSLQTDAARASEPIPTHNGGMQEQADSEENFQGNDQRKPIDEVVVTGTHIRGATPIVPVTVLTREAIEQSGARTLQEVLAQIPQNSGSGNTELTVSSFVPGTNQANNVGFGTGVDLRGFGSDATLVLVNGHRLTQTGAGNFVDLSQIPLTAVERVEVLTDGASAIYGSDAVGGVVNIILRASYDGAETRARYGAVTEGHFSDYGASQSLGKDWGDGNALFTYDFFDQHPLTRIDRQFATAPVGDLLPAQKRNSALLTARERLSDRFSVSIDGLYSKRDSLFRGPSSLASLSADSRTNSDSRNYSLDATLKATLSAAWAGELSALGSRSTVRWNILNLPATELLGDTSDNRLWSIEAKADGPAFRLRSDLARLVAGVAYRGESYVDRIPGMSPRIDAARHVTSAYTELSLPLIGSEDDLRGVRRLALSLAGRYESYSDFGGSTNPQFSALWQPHRDWTTRASYSTSFRAPNFDQTARYLDTVFLTPFPDPKNPSGESLALYLAGSKPNIGPEKSTSATVGIDFAPEAVENLRASTTYFDTDFRQRVATPSAAIFDILTNDAVYAPIISRNPSQAEIAQALEFSPNFVDFSGGAAPSEAQVIIDNRQQNLATTRVRGIDFRGSYDLAAIGGKWTVSVAGTRLLAFKNQVTTAAAASEILNTLFNPINLKVRAGLGWSAAGLNSNLWVNYAAGYTNNSTSTPAPIGSWTTIDWVGGYDVGATSVAHDRGSVSIRLSVQNLLNRQPPYVVSQASIVLPAGYDPANANPLKRVVGLGLALKW